MVKDDATIRLQIDAIYNPRAFPRVIKEILMFIESNHQNPKRMEYTTIGEVGAVLIGFLCFPLYRPRYFG